MNSTFKSCLFWLAIVVAAVAIYQFSSLQQTDKALTFTDFLAKVEAEADRRKSRSRATRSPAR